MRKKDESGVETEDQFRFRKFATSKRSKTMSSSIGKSGTGPLLRDEKGGLIGRRVGSLHRTHIRGLWLWLTSQLTEGCWEEESEERGDVEKKTI